CPAQVKYKFGIDRIPSIPEKYANVVVVGNHLIVRWIREITKMTADCAAPCHLSMQAPGETKYFGVRELLFPVESGGRLLGIVHRGKHDIGMFSRQSMKSLVNLPHDDEVVIPLTECFSPSVSLVRLMLTEMRDLADPREDVQNESARPRRFMMWMADKR